ncbi:MAG: RAM signaling network component [Claussenomyces sp. TS43310]|nr:MAG: RAM signaling network component [Claussenomyces sp. TS43310]
MERPSGMHAGTHSSGRPSVDNNGVAHRANVSNTVRRGPMTTAPQESGVPSSTQIPISAGQVIALAREAMHNALEENQKKAAETSGVSNELKPGVTIDLSNKNIHKFPDEVVDIIKVELERLALSHNLISTFPARFSECNSLRYLNVRNNVIREFPLPICELSSLEILDLGRNKLRILPPQLAKLTSLKVLSIQKNRIEDLPLCFAEMGSLQVLKLDGNPIRFPPKEILQPQVSSPPNGGFLKESEVHDVTVTAQIKKFLKQRAIQDRSETESGGEESSEGAETPRALKRVISGRFPIKVNGAEMPDIRSPGGVRPPPIPSRSHQRGLSQQNAALRRPGVMPLTIGNSNERMRSNSESLLQATRERSERTDRSRRMGIVSRKPPDLGTVDETKANRYSHLRGLSHGSALHSGNGVNGTSSARGQSISSENAVSRAVYVRRLSSLPERKRESSSPDPIIEGAKGILFALYQVHPVIHTLIGLARDGTNKRTSLERVFFNASSQVEDLDRDISAFDNYSEEDEENSPRSNETVHSACLTSILAYSHVCALLSRNVETLLANGDPRYIRTLLLHLYGCLVEVRNARASLFGSKPPDLQPVLDGTLKPHRRDKSITPTRDQPGPSSRTRSATVVYQPSGLRVAVDNPRLAFKNTGRSATMTSATPRSGESFASSSTSKGRSLASGEFLEDDRLFEKIFLCLQQSTEMAIRALPAVNKHFMTAMKISIQQGNPDHLKQYWQILCQKCSIALQTAETLRARLSQIKLKEPSIRTQAAFWELCNAFLGAYYNLVAKVKEIKPMTDLLTNEIVALLRPLQKSVREAGQLIQSSPWSQSSNGSNGGSYGVQSPASQFSLPMTPASAALGPAVQATVPSTPYSAMFSGNVFERADHLLSMTGVGSRSGTMTSSSLMMGGGESFMTPTSVMSPMSTVNGSRYNGSGKVTF